MTGKFTVLTAGDPAPDFKQRCVGNPTFSFGTVAGRYVVLCFFGTASDRRGRRAVDAVVAHRERFDDRRACLFGVSMDPKDEAEWRVTDMLPGIRVFWDFDASVSRLYGVAPTERIPGRLELRRKWVIVDPTMRIMAVFPFSESGAEIEAVFEFLAKLPPPECFAGVPVAPPVLYLPQVFEPDLCKDLIGYYEQHGGGESGFMREVDGKTVGIHDTSYKRRKDCAVRDSRLLKGVHERIVRRVFPELIKSYQFKPRHIERYIVACYAAEDNAHFSAHRDNRTKGTAHRQFAISINLNSDFEGGDLSFPEFGSSPFRPPVGCAVVFSCSLLHKVSQVRSGKRYAFLPFVYDDAGAAIRDANRSYLTLKKGEPGQHSVANESDAIVEDAASKELATN